MRYVCSYVGASLCCVDGAVWLFKAIIKVLQHSSEQQNEFQSINYCPVIFRIMKASPGRIPNITSPSFALPLLLPLPLSLLAFPVSSVHAS